MRFATRTLLAALGVVLWAGPASAQNDVTFEVNMEPFKATCNFDASTHKVYVRGSFNGFDESNELTDGDNNGTYTGTVSLPEGAITYKFYTDSPLAWENDDGSGADGNRDYTVVAGAQSIPSVDFNKENTDNCVTIDIESNFVVDMNVAIARGVFNKDTDKLYFTGGAVGWDNSGNPDYELTESSTEDGVYTGLIQLSGVTPNADSPFKYITRDPDGNVGWESKPGGGDYMLAVPEAPADADNNGFGEVAVDRRFWSEVGFDQVLENPATVTFRVDLRPAEYWLADSTGGLPFAAGAAVESIDGLYLNGPVLWEATENGGPGGGIVDWVAWGADGLGSTATAAFTEDSGNPGFWELTLNYPVGALRQLVGKMGVNGSDNEAGFGNDGAYDIVDGTTFNLVFGAVRKADGSFVDDQGPAGHPSYDPYVMIDNTATPPTAMSVRNGGENDMLVSIEDGPSITGLAIGSAYPNPTNGPAAIDLTLDRALDLRVALYDVVGRQVALLAEGPVAAGETTVEMDVADLSPGVYLLRVEADGQAVVRRMTVLR